MFLIVRTKDQIRKTEKFFNAQSISVASFAVSSTVFNKIEIEDGVDGFIVTSPNAVLSIPQTKLPFFCVGSATEQEAVDTGRRIAYTGRLGATEMAVDVAKKFPPETLIHAAGDMAETEWYNILEKEGIHVIKKLAYETKYTTEIDVDTLKVLQGDTLKALVFFSVQGIITFTKLLQNNNIDPQKFSLIAFSENIALQGSMYKNILIAEEPSLNAVKNIMQSF
tara:strand:+ start:117735 stop:118403 length:669 start_codon:yes stop_codon:yes gene_type:complete